MHAMHLPIQPKSVLYEEFHKYRKLSMIQTPSVELLSSQSIFIDQHRPQDIRYIDSLQRKFKVKLETMDFEDTVSAARLINNHVVNQTRGKIASVVQPQFLVNAKMVLTSSIYFNGKWKVWLNCTNFRLILRLLRKFSFFYHIWVFLTDIPSILAFSTLSTVEIPSSGHFIKKTVNPSAISQ